MTAKTGDFLDGLFELGVQMAAALALCALAMWLWPDELLNTPLGSLTPADLLWAFGSLAVWAIALAWSYFLAAPLQKK
jgi:hypothetical protein